MTNWSSGWMDDGLHGFKGVFIVGSHSSFNICNRWVAAAFTYTCTMCKVPNGLLLQWWGKLGRGKLSCCTKMLDPTTETKRGNFGRYYPWSHALVLHAWVGHGTMGLKCVPLYYKRGLGMGPWVWNLCPCTTSVGWAWDHGFEMCALVPHAWVGHGTMGLKRVNLPPILLRG
jgi:hypothetical protein